ncbi:hypothetical protein [Acidianus brierleyi]|uniref:Uncharacterized protein n=1 Tax=Acidianus brierleyi TaxID=41673 RepID=A0A2U9IDN9_9CREN|nr:hypothetical protein [Acidianus brierleyi]AWR94109.1 hypothetical protein DFR85_05375 [Acidianus brierleyi]
MSLFKKQEKIYHIDHLSEAMRRAIKTLIDSSIPDVAKAYGFKYLTPIIGEPFFVPYGELNGKFKNTHEAFEAILSELRIRRQEAMEKFREWYPQAKEIEHFRFTFYSYTDPKEGMDVGVGANPLASLPEGDFKLGEIKDRIIDKDVIILNSALSGNIANGNSPLSKARSVKYIDFVSNRQDEIVDAYMWLSQTFHERYDKEKDYDPELGKTYMKRLFEVIDQESGKYRTNKIEGDIAILPLFVLPTNMRLLNGNIREVWNKSEEYSTMIRQGRFYDVNVLPILFNYIKLKEIVQEAKNNVNTLIILSDKKMHPLDRDDFLEIGKKATIDNEFVKVIELH